MTFINDCTCDLETCRLRSGSVAPNYSLSCYNMSSTLYIVCQLTYHDRAEIWTPNVHSPMLCLYTTTHAYKHVHVVCLHPNLYKALS